MRETMRKIMKRAWEIRKSYHARALTWSECLKRAWKEAKEALATEQTKAKLAGTKFVNRMTLEVNGITRTLVRWTKGEHDRVYINGGSRRGDGYVDLKTGEAHVGRFAPTAEKMAEIILAMAF